MAQEKTGQKSAMRQKENPGAYEKQGNPGFVNRSNSIETGGFCGHIKNFSAGVWNLIADIGDVISDEEGTEIRKD